VGSGCNRQKSETVVNQKQEFPECRSDYTLLNKKYSTTFVNQESVL
jgi:hypothetical protein